MTPRAGFSQLIQETRQRATASRSTAPARAALDAHPRSVSEAPGADAGAAGPAEPALAAADSQHFASFEPAAANANKAAYGDAGGASVGLLHARDAALGGEPGTAPDGADVQVENGVQEARGASDSTWGSGQGGALHGWSDEMGLCVPNSPDG